MSDISILQVDNISSTSGNGVGFVDGNALNPAVKFTSDPDSGFYRIEENKIGITTGGIKVGEIGIGYGGFIGNIIQVLQRSTYGTVITSNTTVWQSYNALAQSITPRSVSSRILIILSGTVNLFSTAATLYGGRIGINSSISPTTRIVSTDIQINGTPNYSQQIQQPLSLIFLDSPNTTLSVTYTPQYISNQGYNFGFGYSANSFHSLTLMEIQQ
jgi:hypothetical protein